MIWKYNNYYLNLDTLTDRRCAANLKFLTKLLNG